MSEKTQFQPDIQIAATLSAIAYLRGATQSATFSLMARALQQQDLPTNQEWGLVWGPVTHESDLIYIARGPATTYGRKYAVVIRGTVWTVKSVLQNLELELVDLPWKDPDAPAAAKISKGICEAFNRIRAMEQQFPNETLSALDFLKKQGNQNEIMVTGHSLGGCLASVIPLWLRTELQTSGAVIKPYTFAGQSAGNQNFADYFQTVFKENIRFFNKLDIVPRLWNYDTLDSIKSLYPTPGPKCDDFWKVIIDAAMTEAGHNYFQPDNGTEFNGKVYDEKGWFEFTSEVEAQHNHIYYMYLAGISLQAIQGTPFQPGLGAGWWPPGVKPVYEEIV